LIRRAFLAGTVALLGAAPASATSFRFQLHAAYYSRHMEIDPAVDPQVFVPDRNVTVGGIGLEGIEHVAGLRALRLNDPDLGLYTAEGAQMGFTSSRWTAGAGTGSIAALDDGSERIKLEFTNLVVFGAYSLLKKFAGASGDVYVPLDGSGNANVFTADDTGRATLNIVSPQPLGAKSAILAVYHSDGKPKTQRSGTIGTTSHDHLIAPLR